MDDAFYLAVAAAFFAVSALYVTGLKRLQPKADDE